MIAEEPTQTEARVNMVKSQLLTRGITDPRVLAAMQQVPRHIFVPETLQDAAYDDRPLPIGYDQTISQPYIVAYMSQALQLPPNKQGVVLEIGTGSGYQAAILSQLARQVYSIERIAPLAHTAKQSLAQLGLDNVEIKIDDGGYGWPEHGPYDGIITTAAAPELPAPLTTQLKDGGRLIIPVGPRQRQQLVEFQRIGQQLFRRNLIPVAFVPLLGEHGWEGE